MSKINMYDIAGSSKSTIDAPINFEFSAEEIEKGIPTIHQVTVAAQAAMRQGTHKTKTRGEVRGGGRKPFRQKGTGNARQGSKRAPHFTGGGVVHGPEPRDYSKRVNKKVKALALSLVLAERNNNGRVHAVETFTADNAISTSAALKTLRNVIKGETALVVIGSNEKSAEFSLRNTPFVTIVTPLQINAYAVLLNDDVVFTKAAIEELSNKAASADEK
ncbi:MAG: 50S ribosomal protein L4 [Bifidobacteriaceae bacterium]|jgi:large subunit ribosomal protein L4|nr:50S ribosomal protein L4 [Bifidobacteriaceae bacterium]